MCEVTAIDAVPQTFERLFQLAVGLTQIATEITWQISSEPFSNQPRR